MGNSSRKAYRHYSYKFLVERIALSVGSPAEAQRAVERLAAITVDEWRVHIESSREVFVRREKRKVARANRRAERLQLPATLTLEEWLRILEYFDYRCAYCQLPFSYDHLEHVIPLASGIHGTTAHNCAPSCYSCNRSKERRMRKRRRRRSFQRSLFPEMPADTLLQRVSEVSAELRAIFLHQREDHLLEQTDSSE